MVFKFISDIDAENQMSWENSIFLTFDTDWAHETYVNYTLDLLEQYNQPSTWFITNDFVENPKLLRRLIENPLVEIGLHPNF